ncbi:MAG: DNA polymerase [Planctomycetota bacterium]|nr:DNA polymerase [Planctomycetota bacterium]
MTTLAIDCETYLIERTRPFPPVVCLSWSDGERSAVVPHMGVEAFVHGALTDPTARFAGHNVAYDFGVIAASYPALLPLIFDAYKAGRVTDTAIRQQLYDIATGRVQDDDRVQFYSLARLYELIFSRAMPGPGKGQDTWRMRYGELYDVDFADWPDAAVDYSRCDAEATHEIWAAQEKVCAPDKLVRDDAFQAYAAFCLSLTTAQGMRTDPERVAAFKAEQLAVMEALQPELVAEGMLAPEYRGRGDAKHQVGWTKKMAPARERIVAACAAAGIEPMLTKAGDKAQREKKPITPAHTSIDRAACVWADDALMLRRADYVSAAMMIDTYVPVLEAGVDGPVTSRFNLAATGRTTSSGPGAPAVGGNMQNAPRVTKRVKTCDDCETEDQQRTLISNGLDGVVELCDSALGVRECFIPRPGKIFLSGDFSGAELHGVAQVCKWKFGYSTLGDVMKDGRDAHIMLACNLLGRTHADYDDVLASYKQGDPDAVAARQDAKPGNFGFWGGMGVKTFMKDQLKQGKRWPQERAQALKQAWLATWPEAVEYFEANKQELGPGGKAVVEFYWSKRLRKVRGFSTICNGWFQAIVADGAKQACNEVIRRCYVGVPDERSEAESALYLENARPVNFIHDELVLEIDDHGDDRTQEAIDEFVSVMQDEFNELVPDYPTAVDPVLSYMLSKRAQTVRNSNGEVIPWSG